MRHCDRPGQRLTVALDVGGVLLLPSAKHLGDRLACWGARGDGQSNVELHYRSVAAFDRSGDLLDYRRSYSRLLGVPERQIESAARDSSAWNVPWRLPIAGAAETLDLLVRAGHLLVVISDSDGTVQQQLVDAGLGQVGPGPGAAFVAVCDSFEIGVRKPDRRMFAAGLAATGARPDQAVHVGDSRVCDVDGAIAAGLRAVHLDPLGLCGSEEDGHPHISVLADLPGVLRACAG